MTWQPELDELRKREALVKRMGGPEKVKRQHDAGRLTIRERVEMLVDQDSLHEIGAIAGMAVYNDNNELVDLSPSNSFLGRAFVNGRPVVVVGDDFTVRGGSADATIKEKNLMAERMANEMCIPIVRFIEGSGGGGSVKTIETTGRANLPGGVGRSSAYHLISENMATVPSVSLGLGPVAGLGAARMAASHYSLMVKETSQLFVAGPPVVNALGYNLDRNELGGWKIQTRCGAVDDAVDSEAEAIECAKRFLSYLPDSVYSLPARGPITDDPKRIDESLASVIPRDIRRVYKMRPIIETVVDQGSFFEMGRHFGASVITGLARVDGWPVALMASDPYHYAGAWTADACMKITRFIDMAETFHLPVIYLADCPGFLVGPEAESTATIRHGVRAMSAINQTTVPWCSFIVRNAFGVAGGAHQPSGRFCTRYAWLSSRWGSLPLEGGIEAAYRADINRAEDPQAKLREIEQRLNTLRSPFRTAETFWVEEMIDARQTRPLMAAFANLAAAVRKTGKASFTMRP
ncbi:MAG: methylmalonyl-CoA carboxyltransferase [bacterium]|nr:methylmalonyl-CoA carboxyltransferase [bacterium]